MTTPPGHEPPYPAADDPRPWWFRNFEDRLLSELHDIKDAARRQNDAWERKSETTDRRLKALEDDRQQRRGAAMTGRAAALALSAIAALIGVIIGLVTALAQGG